jgi:hypothetical protein
VGPRCIHSEECRALSRPEAPLRRSPPAALLPPW